MEIYAPVSGVVVPLAENPDPVFAEKLAGDGAAVDPISEEVFAPVSGRVSLVHASHHALTLVTEEGVEVLVHVGLDTVALKGEGFEPLVSTGDRVQRGDPVLRFDAELVGRKARSLLTEVVVTTMDRVEKVVAVEGMVEGGKSLLMTVSLDAKSAAAEEASGPKHRSEPVKLINPNGLHARPASVLVSEARKLDATVRLYKGASWANAKSVVSIMKLATKLGDELVVEASGPAAAAAVGKMVELLESGCGEDEASGPAPARVVPLHAERKSAAPKVSAREGEMLGVCAAPGLAIGRVFQLRHEELGIEEAGAGVESERAKLKDALQSTRTELEALAEGSADSARKEILEVQQSLLEDPDLLEQAEALISQDKSAAFAWRSAYEGQAEELAQLGNPVLEARAADIKDVGRRVLHQVTGVAARTHELPEGAIVVAEEVTPSELAGFDPTKLVAMCMTAGSPTSHVSILARNAGLPCLCAVDPRVLSLEAGTRLVVDAGAGRISIDPNAAELDAAQKTLERNALERARNLEAAQALAHTRDGFRVEVCANVSGDRDAKLALEGGAEGIGLLRSELWFHDRDAPPSEAEQSQAYAHIAEMYGKDRPFVLRTVDWGGDKPVSYYPMPAEQNPFLGMRGVRVSLEEQGMFRTQLRALRKASAIGNLHVMFPMVSELSELEAAKAVAKEELGADFSRVKWGIMIEVPSAAMMAEALAPKVDFFSIGTNDLTQYLLAMDRGHPKLASRADALHPAVLRMIRMTCDAAAAHGKWVGICGGVGGDPLAAPVLVGLGIKELSMSVPAIPEVKAVLREWDVESCRRVAREVLALDSAQSVRGYLEEQHARVRAEAAPARVSMEG